MHHVGEADVPQLKRNGYQVASGETWASEGTIEHIISKHRKDLGPELSADSDSLFKAMGKALKKAEFHKPQVSADGDPGVLLYGEVDGRFTLLSLWFKGDGINIGTFHAFERARAAESKTILELI